MRYVPRNLIAVLLGATIVFVSCSQPANMQRAANVVTPPLKNRVPPPDPNKYVSVRDASDWRNPYLTVEANGIHVRPTSTATEAPTMSPGDVVAYLEKLPPIALPYGLVLRCRKTAYATPAMMSQSKETEKNWYVF